MPGTPNVPQLVEHRQWPPQEMMVQLLTEGRDLWMADLLGVNRIEIGWWRNLLGIPPWPRGGSPQGRNEECSVFLRKWGPRIKALDLPQKRHTA